MSSPAEPTPDGILVVDKPQGWTSHDVVARARRLCATRKVGHAGTLDPMATGVLVLGVDRATRLLGHLMLTEKAYDATVRLGVATTTDDAEGEVVATSDASHVTEEQVRAAFAGFVGEIDQVPTAVSAIKVDGKRAYQRVRDGEEVELAARRVTVHELVVREVRGAEVTDLLAALNTGHEGGCGTLHANSAADVPARIEALAMAAGLPQAAVHSQLASAVDVVVHLSRDRAGRRRLGEVAVLERGDDGTVRAVAAARVGADGSTHEGPAAPRLGRLLDSRSGR